MRTAHCQYYTAAYGGNYVAYEHLIEDGITVASRDAELFYATIMYFKACLHVTYQWRTCDVAQYRKPTNDTFAWIAVFMKLKYSKIHEFHAINPIRNHFFNPAVPPKPRYLPTYCTYSTYSAALGWRAMLQAANGTDESLRMGWDGMGYGDETVEQ